MTVCADIIAAIHNSPDLAPISKQNYIGNLSLLIKNISRKQDCRAAIVDHGFTIAALRKTFVGRFASLNAYSAAVMACFKLVPSLKENEPAAFKAWGLVLDESRRALEARVLTSKPTDRQAPGWVPFDQIVAKRLSLPEGSPERLLLAMYSDIPARRNDYADLRIYSSRPSPGTGGNYIVLPKSPKSPVTLTMTSYKTEKRYKDVSQELPDSLLRDIRASLVLVPRDRLFISPSHLRPYRSPNAFAKWANSTLLRLFGRPLTLTIMRHSYVSNLKLDEMTGQEKADIARFMGHSVATQGAYRWIK